MVLKLRRGFTCFATLFENDVNQYGTQTVAPAGIITFAFENDVNQYGTQTDSFPVCVVALFENDVNQYGTQTQKKL